MLQFTQEIQNNFTTRLLTEETTKQNMEEISQIVSTLKSVEGAGRLFIDLRAAMAGNVDANLELENEDRPVIQSCPIQYLLWVRSNVKALILFRLSSS